MNRILMLKRLWLLLLTPISILCLVAAKNNTWIADNIFAMGVYKVISHVIAFLSGLLPFSLSELAIVIGPILLSLLLINFIIRLLIYRRDIKLRILKGIINVLCFLSVLFFAYTVGCGTNYYRSSIATFLGLTVESSSEEELYQLNLQLADEANELRSKINSFDASGVYQLSMSITELGQEVSNAYKKAANEYTVFSGTYPRPKPVFFSKMMSRMEITGIFIPFTMEANVNIDIPDYTIASTMGHELAHLQGFMREDEANYISYFVCSNFGNVELAYSAVLEALVVSGNALYDANKELYLHVSLKYSEGVLADLLANNLYWEKFEDSVISETANKINDTYLKVNNQIDGVKSYGRMVDLLLAEYRSKQQ